MFNTLYKKLAAILFVIIIGIGILLFVIMSYSADMYQQEVNQKLNNDIAEHIVHDQVLLDDGKINQSALKLMFHNLMVINPAIEVYLLDTYGNILSYSAPDEKIKRKKVNLDYIDQFINNKKQYPLFGDDPRNPKGQKVFSAAPIHSDGILQGYLYVILGGETFDGVTEMIRDSYILKSSVIGLIVALIIALAAGLILFSILTRRLKSLSRIHSNYLNNTDNNDVRYPMLPNHRDEIDLFGENFNIMADRIDDQLNKLKQNDAKRRELVANVSHDLRTPLTSLHGYLETLILKEDTLTAQQRNSYLKIVIGHSESLKNLITELFELAKLDSVETLLSVEPFSLAELVQDVSQKYSLSASDSGVKLITNFKQELPFVYGDIALLQRALENLIANALRYTPKGGTITLSLTEHQKNIKVAISDTGCGIDEQDMDHIFDRFYRANKNETDLDENKDQHSGLGLAITKKIVALHGGQIFAESTPNVGTTFTFDLPAYQAS